MTSRNGLRKLPTQFLEKRKNVFELKDQKWSGNGPLNKKTSKNIWQSQKWFLEWVQKLKTNLDLQKTFDIALAQYLISKDFLECIGYIFNHLPKSEDKAIWMDFNCLKVTESLRGDCLLLTTKFPGIPSTHFIHLGRMKGWVNLGSTYWLRIWGPWIRNTAL